MSANTFTLEAAAAANIQLVGSDKGSQAVHDLIVAYQANRRTGSANSKTRAEVSGNNKKIFRQKGTGNARHGDQARSHLCGRRRGLRSPPLRLHQEGEQEHPPPGPCAACWAI